MLEILFGPLIVGTILTPSSNTSVTPNASFNKTEDSIFLSNTSMYLNVSINQTTEYTPTNDTSNDKVNLVNYPYVVSIIKADPYPHQICSGSILTVSTVLTACQCLGNVSSDGVSLFPAETLLVVAGTSKATENSTEKQELLARSLERHSNCRRTGQIVLFDLGLIFLKTPIIFKHGVGKVHIFSFYALSVMNEFDFITKFKVVCYSPGWAYMRPDDELIRDNPVWVISDDECRQSYCLHGNQHLCNARFETQGHICAMPFRNASPCHEDVGGPLICDKRIYGVITNSISGRHLPQLYVSPHVVLQFIEKFIPRFDFASSHLKSSSIISKPLSVFLMWSTTIIAIIE